MNKREFVIGGGATLAASAAWSASGPASLGMLVAPGGRVRRLPDLVADPSAQAWRAYVDQSFDVITAAGPQTLTLSNLSARGGNAGSEQFTLLFNGEDGPALMGGSVTLRHATGQRIVLYVEPAGSSELGRALYRADFNRLC